MNAAEPPRDVPRSLPQRIFVSPDGTRLRAGWRLCLQTALMVFLLGCSGAALLIVLLSGGIASLDPQDLSAPFLLLLQITQAGAFIVSVFLARRLLDKRSIESLGLKLNAQARMDVLMGIGITLVQMGLIYVLMFHLGWLSFHGFAWQTVAPATVALETLLFFTLFIFTGFSEEILSRGYHLQTLASGLNLHWGVILSSVIFGALHVSNPGATWVSTFGILLAGLYFAYAYLLSKQLWLPIGLHIGWNFFEGVVFGFPVSGMDIYPLTRIEVTGPELWTGGAFGPEAGLIVLPSLVVGGILIYLFTRNRSS